MGVEGGRVRVRLSVVSRDTVCVKDPPLERGSDPHVPHLIT